MHAKKNPGKAAIYAEAAGPLVYGIFDINLIAAVNSVKIGGEVFFGAFPARSYVAGWD